MGWVEQRWAARGWGEERACGLWSPQRQLLGRGWNRRPLLSFLLQLLCCVLWGVQQPRKLGFGFSGLLVEERFQGDHLALGPHLSQGCTGEKESTLPFILPAAPKHPLVSPFSLQVWEGRWVGIHLLDSCAAVDLKLSH